MARRPAAAWREVPAFALYGEPAGPGAAAVEALHVEAVRSRSRLYRWEIQAHVHQGLHQLLWLEQGEAQVSLDELRTRVAAPAAVLIPPGTVHAFRFAPDSDGVVLTLRGAPLLEGEGASAAAAALQALFDEPRLLSWPAAADAAQRLAALLRSLLAEFNAPGAADSPAAMWLARAVVWILAREAAPRQRAGAPRQRGAPGLFNRFLALVENHHREPWPVERYAAVLGLSRERLNRLVRAETGRNALALVHQRLLREACRRLVYIEAPVARIGYELGFEDAAYFTRFFKRLTGETPSAYRARHRAGP